MDAASAPYKVHQCFKCSGDTEYFCISCSCYLCSRCTNSHVKDIKTLDHNIVTFRDKFTFISTQEVCERRHGHFYTEYCEPCKVLICYHCTEHIIHRTLDVRTAYETKRQQHKGTINAIRSEALLYRPVLLKEIKADIKACHNEFSIKQSKMLTKAHRLNNLIKVLQNDFMCNVFCDFNFKHRCLKQKITIYRHIASLQRYTYRYEQSAISPLQFLFSIKAVLIPKLHLRLHTSQLSMTESLSKKEVSESLSGIQITERGHRRLENECLLKLMAGPEFRQSLTLTGVDECFHISCVTSDRIWISNRNNIILTNTTNLDLHFQINKESYSYGCHTVNNENELIYLDKRYNINKLSKDLKTTDTFIETTDLTWEPWCVHWSSSTGDLLIGMCYIHTETGKVTRYNQSGQLTQTIQHNDTGRRLYSQPIYITENNDGDVVVSDIGAVVVTERGGRHRFSYTGQYRSGLQPHGICTDALSHILVCDHTTKTVHMIDRDGKFLSYLLTGEMGVPHSLSYDINTHRLLVGSLDNNKLCVYRYITRQDALTEQINTIELLCDIQSTETEKTEEANICLLKLMSLPELLHSLTVTGVDGCDHISCIISDHFLISERNNLILTNTTGVTLHHLEDLCSGFGVHTLNSERELIYIDRDYNIKKLSKNMNSSTMFIERTDSTWRPQCVFWSSSTGDLLVGLWVGYLETGKVTRYNQSGQLTQTMQHNNTGLKLYRQPIYITANKNGDVVVSDFDPFMGAVVVTEREGKHRFSYTGHPSGSGLWPHGICTDTLSHILVCDTRTKTVHIIDSDGKFLSYLLTQTQKMGVPQSLSYDGYTNLLLVGSSDNNTLCVYRYITTQDVLTEEPRHHSDGDVLSISRPALEWR